MSATSPVTTEWTAAELADRLDRPQPLMMLDVRNRDEFDAWTLEGRHAVPTLNVPYFEMLERGAQDDMGESVREFFSAVMPDALPRDRTVLAVCAKGGTSDLVALELRRMGFDAVNLAGGMEAWARYYRARTVVEGADLAIEQVGRPARGCLSYVVVSGGSAVVIDPLRHVDPYLEVVHRRGARITAVVDTHAHADHVSGGPRLARETGARYWLHPFDAVHPFDLLPARLAFEYLCDGQRLTVGDAALRVVHVPGHTLGNTALVLEGRYLLSGDTIFLRSVARPDLGGRSDAWAPLHADSLRRLLELPDATLVLPGHASSAAEADDSGVFAAPLGRLRRENPELRRVAEDRDAFVQHLLRHPLQVPPQYVQIKRVNAGLAEAGEEQSFELEIGKNVCGLSASHASPAA